MLKMKTSYLTIEIYNVEDANLVLGVFILDGNIKFIPRFLWHSVFVADKCISNKTLVWAEAISIMPWE